MPKTRTHKITVSITFNKPLSRAAALREFKDNIHGEHYTSFGWQDEDEDKYPGTFKIGAAKLAKP
jgi:hypothetical protein